MSFVDKWPYLSTKLRTLYIGLYTGKTGWESGPGEIVTEQNSSNSRIGTYEQSKISKKAYRRAIETLYTNTQHLRQTLLYLYVLIKRVRRCGKLKKYRVIILELIFISLPWGLGKHFRITDSFIGWDPVPYLIPTIYIQDLLIVTFILLSVLNTKIRKITFYHYLLFLLAVVTFLSVFFSARLIPSLYASGRVILYSLFIFFSWDLFSLQQVRRAFFLTLFANAVLIGFMGIAQFMLQRSVFGNYIIFGEQPYSSVSLGLVRESFSGITKIPPYGTFSHPNILGGYLTISLIMVLGYLSYLPRSLKHLRVAILLALPVFLTLYLTKSYTSWLALLVGIFLLMLGSVKPVVYLYLGLLIILSGFALPLYSNWLLLHSGSVFPRNDTSVIRRDRLIDTAVTMVKEKPIFGWGINSFTYASGKYYLDPVDLGFAQPVHNIFLLLLTECGLVGFLILLLTVSYVFYRLSCLGRDTYIITFIAITVLSSFDHYFFTIPQTTLLLILTLSLGLTYTKGKAAYEL